MLDSDPANHLADEATDEPTPANAMQQPVADDLPRPPSGRRSAIRPAGPPQPVSWPIPEPVPAELPTEPAEEPAAPEEQGVADVAPQAEEPTDVTPGPVSDESTATSDAESVEAPEGVGAQQAPVQEVSTENTQPQQEPSDQPAAMPAEQPLFSFGVENALLVALGRYSRYAVLVLVSGLVCFTIVSIVNIVVDLLSLRDQTRGNYSAPYCHELLR